MSGLNIRSFAKAEPNGDVPDTAADQTNGSRVQPPQNDSDDSDEGIQYLAPDQTPSGMCNLRILCTLI